jgi:hypothetical protein
VVIGTAPAVVVVVVVVGSASQTIDHKQKKEKTNAAPHQVIES